ncbi:MAG TPA: hypothetical protein VJX93_03730 [Candidatus Methanomethylophilaceae archaeon]|nr:hypothetical protein [Candidatus Methanomethylophilaceae archaeon]
MAEYVYNKARYRRPILLSIIALLMVLSGMVIAILGVMTIIGNFVMPSENVVELGVTAVGAITIITGIVNVLVGLALFSGERWAWWFAAVIVALNLILSLISVQVAGILLYLIVFLYLMTKNTRGWFKV